MINSGAGAYGDRGNAIWTANVWFGSDTDHWAMAQSQPVIHTRWETIMRLLRRRRKCFQRFPHGQQQRRRVGNREVIDHVMIEFDITVREYVAKPDDVPRVRDFFRNGRCCPIETVHGFTADFQHALLGRSGFFVCQVLFQA
jgi:hypothetical protein